MSQTDLCKPQAVIFPGVLCTAGDRPINNNDPVWPNALEGFAQGCHDLYKTEQQLAGYRLQA